MTRSHECTDVPVTCLRCVIVCPPPWTSLLPPTTACLQTRRSGRASRLLKASPRIIHRRQLARPTSRNGPCGAEGGEECLQGLYVLQRGLRISLHIGSHPPLPPRLEQLDDDDALDTARDILARGWTASLHSVSAPPRLDPAVTRFSPPLPRFPSCPQHRHKKTFASPARASAGPASTSFAGAPAPPHPPAVVPRKGPPRARAHAALQIASFASCQHAGLSRRCPKHSRMRPNRPRPMCLPAMSVCIRPPNCGTPHVRTQGCRTTRQAPHSFPPSRLRACAAGCILVSERQPALLANPCAVDACGALCLAARTPPSTCLRCRMVCG